MRGPMNESRTTLKTHELHSIMWYRPERQHVFEIASQWVFQSVIGETLSKSTINKAHRKINNKGAISYEQICVNKYRMGKLGKPEETIEKSKSEDEEINFPSEEISLAMYKKKKMEERKRKLSPEDGSKTLQSCKKKIKFGDDLVNSAKRKKRQSSMIFLMM